MAVGAVGVFGETIVTANGVTIVAPDNLPATMPRGLLALHSGCGSTFLMLGGWRKISCCGANSTM